VNMRLAPPRPACPPSPPSRALLARALAALTILIAAGVAVALPSLPTAADGEGLRSPGAARVLVGLCVDESGAPVRGRLEVFFEVPPDSSARDPLARTGVVKVELDVPKAGTYRLDVPAGARAVDLRLTTKSGVHFGPRVWLRGRDGSQASNEITVDPITCGALVPVRVSITDEDGGSVDDGALYYFAPNQYPGETIPLSRGQRACHRVAELDGSGVIELDGIPRAGGYLRVDARDKISVSQRLKAAPGRGALTASFVMKFAPSLAGMAPGKDLYGPEFEGRAVLIAALRDPVASNARENHAFVFYDHESFLAEFDVEAGVAFDLGGVSGYMPVLCAWKEGRSVREPPDLIAARDEASGRYVDWVQPQATQFEIALPKLGATDADLLGDAPLTGSLRITSSGGSYGPEISATWGARGTRSITVEPKGVFSAGGRARLKLKAGAAVIFDEEVDFHGGIVEVSARTIPALSRVTVRVRGRSNSKPVPGAIVEAFTDSDEDNWRAVWRFETDEDGHATGLFARGQDIRLVADASMFGQVDPIELVANRASITVDVLVDSAFGGLEVRLGAIDDAPCRVSLIPEQDPPYASYRVAFPGEDADVSGWLVESAGVEIAAAAIRPGGTFLFERVPAGRYIVAVQTNLDLARASIYADVRLACGGPHARTVEVEDGSTSVVEIAAPETIEASLPLVVSKAIAKMLKKPEEGALPPAFRAEVALVLGDSVNVGDPPVATTLTMTPELSLTGTLNKGWAYVVRVSGVGAVDSLHVVRPGTEAERIRLDGTIVIEIRGSKKGPCRVEIEARSQLEDGRSLWAGALESVLELEPHKKRIRLDGLSPFAKHIIRVTRAGTTGSIEVDPLVNDKKAKRDRRSGTIVRTVRLKLE